MPQIRNQNDGLADIPHMTITKIIRREKGLYYGFAVTQSGETVYLPTQVCVKYALTAADVGAGFRSPLERERQTARGRAAWRAHAPMLFDDKTPREVSVGLQTLHQSAISSMDTDSTPDLDPDLEALLEAVDDVLTLHTRMRGGEAGPVGLFKALDRLQRTVDEKFPVEEGATS